VLQHLVGVDAAFVTAGARPVLDLMWLVRIAAKRKLDLVKWR